MKNKNAAATILASAIGLCLLFVRSVVFGLGTAAIVLPVTASCRICSDFKFCARNRTTENASKSQLGVHKKMFIRSTALYVFNVTEPFITIKTKCVLYYSSNPSNEQAVECLILHNSTNSSTIQSLLQYKFNTKVISVR